MALQEKNQDATIYVGNLDERINESLLWELFVQAGPVVKVYIPKDRVTQLHQGFGFVEFMSEQDAEYTVRIMNQIKLFGKPIRINKASSDKKHLDVGANLFVGNLSLDVDEQVLQDTFGAFGQLIEPPKVGREPDTGISKGYAFIMFNSFDAADAAIEAMNGQWLANRQITVSYAFKKDGKGERHGSAAERMLAQQGQRLAMEQQQQRMMAMSNPYGMPSAPPPTQ